MEIRKPLSNKLLGHFAFMVLFFLAIVYYLERSTYVDPAYAVFNNIVFRTFIPQAGRLAAVIPQALPLMGIILHLPLTIILILFSVSFVLLYYLVYLVIVYWFRNEEIALAVPLVLMLGIRSSYFWISTESHQALVYSILFFAFLIHSRTLKPGILNTLKTLIIGTVILILCFYSHPVSVFTVLFSLGYFVIDGKQWKNPLVYVMGALIILMTLFKVFTAPDSGYETSFYKDFLAFFTRIPHVGSSRGFLFIRDNLLNIYLFPVVIFLATTLFYLFKKQFLKMAYYMGSILLFSLILFTTFNYWVFPFLMEKNLMPLTVFLLLPFMKDVVFKSLRLTLVKQFVLSAAFFLTVVNVVTASSFYRERISYIRILIDRTKKFPEKKFILDQRMTDHDKLNIMWGVASESLLISSLESPDSARTIYLITGEDSLARHANLKFPRLFLSTPWQLMDIWQFDKRYFNLGNSSYRTLAENDIHDPGAGGVLYFNDFDDPGFRIGDDRTRHDSSGNSIFMMTQEYGPGFTRRLSEITGRTSIYVSASVWVYPLEVQDPASFFIIISREQGTEIREYYMSEINRRTPLRPNFWNKISVSGVIHRNDVNDILKVYIWNRSLKKVMLDDMMITYSAN